MNKRIRHIIEGTDNGRWPLTAQSLLILSHVFGMAAKARLRLYDKGILKTRRLPCTVISIGNLTSGGTGKTPMTMYVARRLQQMGARVAILSRGYKGRAEKKGGWVSDGRRMLMDPDWAGDEAYMMAAKLPGVAVLVGKDRYRSGLQAVRDFGAQVAILDDGYQHLSLDRDLNLLLLDSRAPLGNGHLLPRGPLRMPAASAARADAVIFTRCDEASPPSRTPALLQVTVPIFRSCHHLSIYEVYNAAGRNTIAQLKAVVMSNIKGLEVLGFSGISDNDKFKESLISLGLMIKDFAPFPDHYRYSYADLRKIGERASRMGAGWLATTEKDFFRICHRLEVDARMIVVGTDLEFLSNLDFDQFLIDHL